MSDNTHTQLVVIGAGPGGYAAAFHAADLGLEVTLVDKDVKPGGVCLFRGCIPSKALLHAAEVIQHAKEAATFGVNFDDPRVDIRKLAGWKDDVVKKLTDGLAFLAKKRKVTFVQGTAAFVGENALRVDSSEGPRTLEFDNAIIATGSSPVKLPFLPESGKIMDSTDALELKDIPGKLLVIGGGYIGLELGHVYATLGSKVTVAEMMPELLPGADQELVGVLKKRLSKEFEAIRLKTKASEVKETDNGLVVTFEDEKGDKSNDTFDKILIAVGRKPNSSNLGLDGLPVEITQKGFIVTDEQRRTGVASIFAIGDVAGEPMLAHKATYEGKIAAEVCAGKKSAYDAQAVPAVIFTDPEIAWCGMTEVSAEERNLETTTCIFPWAASGRSLTLGRREGMTKLLFEKKSGRILGGGIVGNGAGELIGELVHAIEMGSTATDLAMTIHPHPTLSETIMEAAEMFEGKAISFFK